MNSTRQSNDVGSENVQVSGSVEQGKEAEKPGYGTLGEQTETGRLVVFLIVAAVIIAGAIVLRFTM